MSSPNRFQNLSARVLNALDRDFPGWQDLVPTEKDAELTEESLIDLLKDRKRAEIYRTVADKRNAFLKEAYEGSDKSFAELTQEFAAFSYEQTHKWFDMEEKLSSIKLEFRAQPKNEPVNIESVDQSLSLVTQKIGEGVDVVINNFNSSMNDVLDSFFNKDVNGVSRAGSSELKSFLEGKVNQFKEENKKIANSQKNFLDTKAKKLIQTKLDLIKSGELDAGALNRSDLFTDEEVSNLREAQEQVLFDAMSDRVKSNVDSVNEMAQKFIGVSGKEDILKYLDKCPKHIVTDEVKNAVAEVIDRGCILGGDSSSDDGAKRVKRSAKFNAISLLLDNTSFMLSELADKKVEESFKDDYGEVYEFCNSGTYYTAHIFTLGWCSGYTLLANTDAAAKGKPVDYAGISAILSGISFFVGLFTAKTWFDLMFKVIIPTVAQVGCTYIDKGLGKKDLAKACSTVVLLYNNTLNFYDIFKSPKFSRFFKA